MTNRICQYLAMLCFLAPSLGNAFEPFVDALPIPPRIVLPKDKESEITIKMEQFRAKIHRDLPAVEQWGYNGSVPGPTIEVEADQKLRVHWVNALPTKHLLATPKGINMSHGGPALPDVRAVVHLHGAVVTQPSITDRKFNNDGWPDAWLVPGEEQIAEYPNKQSARLLWYHDHAMGTTGRNVAAGLAGLYIIHDNFERSLNLPTGDFDIPLMLHPRKLKGDGTIDYVDTLAREHYGNAMFVNGKLNPFLEVEPRKYRFRVLNASNARTMALKLVNSEDLETPGPAFVQIGSDSGFLAAPVTLNDPRDTEALRLTLAPAERADIIIDFTNFAGKNFVLHNNALPDDVDGTVPLYQVMLFKVKPKSSSSDEAKIPSQLQAIRRMQPSEAITTRKITFDEMEMDGMPMLTLNRKMWRDPVSERPVLGTTEVWELINTLPDSHPFHIHLVDFQVLDRRPFDLEEFQKSGKIIYTGEIEAPDANEMGWKDTTRVTVGRVTRIIMRFTPHVGHYVYHCHILEHEDMDMMRPFDVVAP